MQGSNTPDARGQQVFSVVQDFNINTLNIVKQGSNESQNTENQDHLPPPPPAPALPTDPKKINLAIYEDQVFRDEKKVNVDDFVKTMDNITSEWSKDELENARVWLKTEDPDKKIMAQLEDMYKKTNLLKAQPSHGLISPPPPGYNNRKNKLSTPDSTKNQLPAPPPAPDLEDQKIESVSTTAQNTKNIDLKIYDQKINMEGKEVEAEFNP